jgi:hypothetical protein
MNEEEKLKVENDFLRLKIMAEHGGHFLSGNAEEELPDERENSFLNSVLEFEQQWANRKTITVFEKIGRPQHFEPENEIPGEAIELAWQKLSDYMSEHGVALSVCSPNVNARQLYRFAMEELFELEIDDINTPGMMIGFIYDEFYPDHKYDNTRAATDDCIDRIFSKEPFESMHYFMDNLRLNDHFPLTRDHFKEIINRFKDCYDDIELTSISAGSCEIKNRSCMVKGCYSAYSRLGNDIKEWTGNWSVEFLPDDYDYWCIKTVWIEGVSF